METMSTKLNTFLLVCESYPIQLQKTCSLIILILELVCLIFAILITDAWSAGEDRRWRRKDGFGGGGRCLPLQLFPNYTSKCWHPLGHCSHMGVHEIPLQINYSWTNWYVCFVNAYSMHLSLFIKINSVHESLPASYISLRRKKLKL